MFYSHGGLTWIYNFLQKDFIGIVPYIEGLRTKVIHGAQYELDNLINFPIVYRMLFLPRNLDSVIPFPSNADTKTSYLKGCFFPLADSSSWPPKTKFVKS